MKIAVIGAGYVGLVSAACFAEIGHEVITVDNNEAKVERLKAGQVPIHEELLPELLRKHGNRGLRFSSSIAEAFEFCDIAFICVGTPPSPNGTADLSYVEGVACELAKALNGHKVVVEKSTVPVGTCDAIRRTMMMNGARPDQFSIASNPEFLREGTAVSDFLYPDRILLGVHDARSTELLKSVYAPLLNGSYYERPDCISPPLQVAAKRSARLIVTSVKSAELIKHASNAFLALKISFINSVANVCERVGADVREVAEGMGADSRIGARFLQPGLGYGGSCFPKDVSAFHSVAESVGYDFSLLTAVMEVNEDQKTRFIAKVREALWTLRGKRLAVLGLAFKGGTDDVRDSPAIEIVERLVAEGVSVVAFDPVAMEKAQELLGVGAVQYASDAYSACTGADGVLILTEWPEFKNLDLKRVRSLLNLPVLLDGKNLLDPSAVSAAGITYFGVGTSPVHGVQAASPAKVAATVPSDVLDSQFQTV